eukprot:2587048-Pleurochrysis_carterae.AAC.1
MIPSTNASSNVVPLATMPPWSPPRLVPRSLCRATSALKRLGTADHPSCVAASTHSVCPV